MSKLVSFENLQKPRNWKTSKSKAFNSKKLSEIKAGRNYMFGDFTLMASKPKKEVEITSYSCCERRSR